MSASSNEIVHTEPVWRDKADFIIGAALPEGRAEQLWARQLGERRFEICCIPFFVFDLALGDIVETDVDYTMSGVVEASGRFTFRVWFGDSFHPREDIEAELITLGALVEWSSVNLLAVDAADAGHAQTIANFLQERTDLGQLIYETGRSA